MTHVINLANELTRRGDSVVVAAPFDAQGQKGRYEALECNFVPTDFESRHFSGIIGQLNGVVDRYKIQVIHSHNRNTSLYAKYIQWRRRIPFVWTLHQDNVPTRFPYRQLTFPGDRTIVVSGELKSFCVEKLRIPEEKIEVIYNGIREEDYARTVDTDGARQKYGIGPDETVIVLLSRLERRKGHMVLLKALTRIANREKLKVLITGTDLDNGEYRGELERFIRENGLEDLVCFVGYVNPVEILSVSNAMVLPSEKEGQPIAVNEAFLMRVPVIRTKTGGYEDTRDYCIGIDDENDLALALERVLNDRKSLEAMAQGAYAFARGHCTVGAMTGQVRRIYGELVRR